MCLGVIGFDMNTPFGYIYRTTNLLNGRFYVGKHEGSFDRRYTGSGTAIMSAVEKYGLKNFSVKQIAFGDSRAELYEIEKRLVRLHRKIFGAAKMYNIVEGGWGSVGYVCSEETKEKIRQKRKLQGPTRLGSKQSEQTKNLIRQKRLGTTASAETKEKMRISHLGNTNPLGFRHTEESKIKIRQCSLDMWEKRRILGTDKKTIIKSLHTRAKNRAAKIFDNHPSNVASLITKNDVSDTSTQTGDLI